MQKLDSAYTTLNGAIPTGLDFPFTIRLCMAFTAIFGSFVSVIVYVDVGKHYSQQTHAHGVREGFCFGLVLL